MFYLAKKLFFVSGCVQMAARRPHMDHILIPGVNGVRVTPCDRAHNSIQGT